MNHQAAATERTAVHGAALRILMLDNEYPPLGGGTGVVNYHLLDELSRLDGPRIEVDLVTSSRSRATYEYDELTPAIRLHKVPVDNRNIHHSTNIELLRYTVRGYRYARRLAGKQAYDLCFAFAGVPAGGIALALHRRAGLPYIVSLQGPDVPGFEQRYRWVYLLLTPFIRQVWREAAAVLAISRQHRALAARTAPYCPIEIIPNGVDVALFENPRRRARTAGEPLTVLCAARLIERKGQHYLLAAAARLKTMDVPAFRLMFAGTGDFEPALRQQSAALGLSAHVEFLGFVPRQEMPGCYAKADLFCLPSYNEGMSMALLEAMAGGLPVVVTDTGGVEELVDGNGYVVPWADVPRLAEALAALLRDPAQRAALGARSRTIAGQFTWPAITQQYVELFTRLTQGEVVPGAHAGQQAGPGVVGNARPN